MVYSNYINFGETTKNFIILFYGSTLKSKVTN